MLMTDKEITSAMDAGDLVIDPFDDSCLKAASYDARIGDRALIGGTDKEVDVSKNTGVTIRPGEFVLVVTRERFKLCNSLAGHLGVKSYFTRKGLVVLAGLQIDPGFDGHLVIGGYNASPRRLTLDHDAPFLTIEFHKLSHDVATPYISDEEQKRGLIPRIDKDYLRTLETQSLSDVASELRQLTQNVSSMQTMTKFFYVPLLIGTFLAVIGFGLASLLK